MPAQLTVVVMDDERNNELSFRVVRRDEADVTYREGIVSRQLALLLHRCLSEPAVFERCVKMLNE
jgi:hypothetical protein